MVCYLSKAVQPQPQINVSSDRLPARTPADVP